MNAKKIGITAAAVAAAALAATGLILTGNIANAETPSATTSPSISANAGDGFGPRGPMGGQHTVVTGAEAQRVIDAVKAKDSTVTVDRVLKDPDGSYDAMGTKDGARIRFDVSADLTTVVQGERGPGGGGPGFQDTVVTGAEAQRVIDAVEAKNSGVNIEAVRKDADGSYDAVGTKDGARICFEVSADLGTITENAPRMDGNGPHGPNDGSTTNR